MIALTKSRHRAEAAYRTLLGHTVTCGACRVGAACITAVRLGRAWRAVRR
ncbi:hypothetical protein ACIA8E_36245 [Streptomyces sp. NPDC051664]